MELHAADAAAQILRENVPHDAQHLLLLGGVLESIRTQQIDQALYQSRQRLAQSARMIHALVSRATEHRALFQTLLDADRLASKPVQVRIHMPPTPRGTVMRGSISIALTLYGYTGSLRTQHPEYPFAHALDRELWSAFRGTGTGMCIVRSCNDITYVFSAYGGRGRRWNEAHWNETRDRVLRTLNTLGWTYNVDEQQVTKRRKC